MPTVKTLLPQKQADVQLIRVAAYCRVSSDSTEQKESFAAQVEYYTAFSTEALEAEAEVLTGEVNTVAELIQKCVDENARVAQDQTEYEKRYDALVQRFDTARAKLDETQAAITKKQAQRQMMENFMDVLRSLPEQVEIFDEGTWYALCDYITVYGKDDIRVTFRNGMEIPV